MSAPDDEDTALCIVYSRTIPKKKLPPKKEEKDPKNTEEVKKQQSKLNQDFDVPSDLRSLKFAHLVKAVQMANEQEAVHVDKFVNGVENLVTEFQSEFSKWQDVFENIKKKMPELED